MRLPFDGNFGEKFPSNGTGIFLAPKTGTGLSCSIYKIPVNFSLSLDMKPVSSNPDKWYRKFRSFQQKREKVIPRKVLLFFPENFHRDEPLYLTSPQNFRVFHTNGKLSTSAHRDGIRGGGKASDQITSVNSRLLSVHFISKDTFLFLIIIQAKPQYPHANSPHLSPYISLEH